MSCKKTQRDINQKQEAEKTHWVNSATKILHQFNEQHAFWLMSVLAKCYYADRDMTMPSFRNIVIDALPEAYKDYNDYIKHT